MSRLFIPRAYQVFTTQKIIDLPYCSPWVDMGLGKTASTLSAIIELKKRNQVKKVLVIAPKKVAESVWKQEGEKWQCFNHLKITLVLGTEVQRKNALLTKSDIWVINRENVVWLVAHYGSAFPFDMVVIDESSSFKNVTSARFKAMRQIRPKINRVVNLTGTPTPNGLLQLWPQMYLLDRGDRLGKTFPEYRRKYFAESGRVGERVVKYELKGKKGYEKGLGDILGHEFAEMEIHEKVSDLCFSLKSEDYLDLPKKTDVEVPVILPSAIMQQYKEFERDLVLSLADDINLTAVNSGALSQKLTQFANGAVYYDDKKNYYEVHNEKIKALEEIYDVANGQSVLTFYWYNSDLERILKHLKAYQPRVMRKPQDVIDWNSGKYPGPWLLHPVSGGHGLNLQDGGYISAWFSNTWDLETKQQADKRLHRDGQLFPVINNQLCVKGTIDEKIIESNVLKAAGQDSLLNFCKALIKKYRP